MGMSAFGVEDDRISKAGLGAIGAKVGRKIGGLANSGGTGARLGRQAGLGLQSKVVDPIKAGVLKPLKFTPEGVRVTPAGMTYAAGAGGLGAGYVASGRKRQS